MAGAAGGLLFASWFGTVTADADDSATVVPKKFNHEQHAGLDKPVEVEECGACHGDDRDGKLATPGARAHQPCLTSGCHVADFLASGAATKKRDPKRHDKARSFCAGCHADSGQAPSNYEKPKTEGIYGEHPSPEYHVDLDHLGHTKEATCRECHQEQSTLKRPGHAECSGCHGGEKAPPMSECANCHKEPAPASYFTDLRKGSETRDCGSKAHQERVEKAKARAKPGEEPKAVPCFRHDTREHSFWSTLPKTRSTWNQGEPLQCGHCHYMLEEPKTWKSLGHTYQTVKEIKGGPIIDNTRDRAHRRCGDVVACHKSEVDDSSGRAPCQKCHDKKTVDSIFGP